MYHESERQLLLLTVHVREERASSVWCTEKRKMGHSVKSGKVVQAGGRRELLAIAGIFGAWKEGKWWSLIEIFEWQKILPSFNLWD